MPGNKRWIRGLSNSFLKSDPNDHDFQREIRRRKKRNGKRPVKEVGRKTAPRQSLLEDATTGVMPSGRRGGMIMDNSSA
jgi:hypothetical protein